MTNADIRTVEECLYVCKYLFGRIQELELEMTTKLPPLPGSVLKMVGKPVAKTPVDTSQTESWGIHRATCGEAEELCAKKKLREIVLGYKKSLDVPEREFVRLKYDKELPARRVKETLRLDHAGYYGMRLRILKGLWTEVSVLDNPDMALK